MICLSEELLQALDQLHRHDLLATVIVSFNHHWLQSESPTRGEPALAPVGFDSVLPLVFERVIHEVRCSPSG